MATVDNWQDVLDSRDIIARIQELEDAKESAEESGEPFDGEDAAELEALSALADDASASPDWKYGETLIRDSYFEDYARELAEDIGAISRDADWPLSHIDWPAAADALKQDYMEVDYGGVSYWICA